MNKKIKSSKETLWEETEKILKFQLFSKISWEAFKVYHLKEEKLDSKNPIASFKDKKDLKEAKSSKFQRTIEEDNLQGKELLQQNQKDKKGLLRDKKGVKKEGQMCKITWKEDRK